MRKSMFMMCLALIAALAFAGCSGDEDKKSVDGGKDAAAKSAEPAKKAEPKYFTYEPDGAGFSVELPESSNKQSKQTHEIPTALGAKEMVMYIAEGKTMVFMVSVTKAEEALALKEEDIKPVLQESADGMASKDEMISSEFTMHEGIQAMNLRYKKAVGSQTAFGRALILWVDGVFYQFQALSENDKDLDNDDVNKAFETFHIKSTEGEQAGAAAEAQE